jgi:hypothetical protein
MPRPRISTSWVCATGRRSPEILTRPLGSQQAHHPLQQLLLVVGFLHQVVGAGAAHRGVPLLRILSIHTFAFMWCWRSLVVLALLLCGTAGAQWGVPSERKAILLGDATGVIERLKRTLDDAVIGNDTLLQARTLETLGEQYHRLSEIGEAQHYWERAFELRAQRYGPISPEAGIGHAWLARYHNYMAAPQLDHNAEALRHAQLAMELLGSGNGDVAPWEHIMALREEAYAFKVNIHWTHALRRELLEETRAMYRRVLALARSEKDTLWIVQLQHDIGNTHTDLSRDVRLDRAERDAELRQALFHYGRSKVLLKHIGLVPSEASMMEHYSAALAFFYAHGADSIRIALQHMDSAMADLRELHLASGTRALEQGTIDRSNAAQMVELLGHRAQFLYSSYQAQPDLATLDDAIGTLESSITYWERMLLAHPGRQLYKTVGSYTHFPFHFAAHLRAVRHEAAGDPADAWAALLMTERDRAPQRQRSRLLESKAPAPFLGAASHTAQLRPPPGTLIISYHLAEENWVYILGKHGLELMKLGPIGFDATQGQGPFRDLRIDSMAWTPASYAKASHTRFERLIAPLLSGRKERDLVIIPSGSIANLSFEALSMSPTATSWADMNWLGSAFTIRYAYDMEQALAPYHLIPVNDAFIGMVGSDTLSRLPFAWKLHERLAHRFNLARVDQHTTGERLAAELQRPGALHLATHAHASDEPDGMPYLVVSNGTWTAADAENITVRRDLVVLNTCSSGRGRVYIGQGTISMGNALLESGCRAVVHTLWPVDDQATSEILASMYDGLERGMVLSRALHKAKEDFRMAHANDGMDHPYYWAGIIHTGEDIRLRNAPLIWPWAMGSFLLLLVAGVIYSKRSRRRRDLSATMPSSTSTKGDRSAMAR